LSGAYKGISYLERFDPVLYLRTMKKKIDHVNFLSVHMNDQSGLNVIRYIKHIKHVSQTTFLQINNNFIDNLTSFPTDRYTTLRFITDHLNNF
jgi:hypothetical protein